MLPHRARSTTHPPARPTASLAKALDKALGAPGTFARLERRLRNLPFPAAFRSFAPYEAEAATLRSFEHSLVAGLLQTPEYARAVLETKPNASDEMIDGYVSARLARQSVLSREDPPVPLVYALVLNTPLRTAYRSGPSSQRSVSPRPG